MKLENWKMVELADPFMAPEMRSPRLGGNVHGNPRFEEGYAITTSPIESVEGRVVTTRSGSVYELGDPDPEYLKWCQENGQHIPLGDNPIKLKK